VNSVLEAVDFDLKDMNETYNRKEYFLIVEKSWS
jgi:hypothetical protein